MVCEKVRVSAAARYFLHEARRTGSGEVSSDFVFWVRNRTIIENIEKPDLLVKRRNISIIGLIRATGSAKRTLNGCGFSARLRARKRERRGESGDCLFSKA